MYTRRFVVCVALFTQSVAARAQLNPARTDVPIRNVMLFSSGVGYFEHAGTVRGNGSTELRFKTGQINDVLKSLVLQDLDGGMVRTVTYASQDPIEKTLLSFQVDITGNPGLAALLTQLRGAKVIVQSAGERISGTILGVEVQRKMATGVGPFETTVLNLIDGATIRSIDLPSVSGLALDDPRLQEELAKALVTLRQARDRDKKSVAINFSGNGERRVRVGYVVDTPIWKTSYRLLLGDTTNRMQGWAIVENQTDSDWNDVTLSLVSGRPISFMMDLYRPVYATRPTVAQELFGGLKPQLYDGGISSIGERVPLSYQPPSSQPQAPQRLGSVTIQAQSTPIVEQGVVGSTTTISNHMIAAGPPSPFSEAKALQQIDAAASVRSAAAPSRLGELFQYAVPNVTLARQTSAMIPIVTDSVAVERISIYNASVLVQHPLNGVRLTNTTGRHLLQGPVTVLDKNGYAGDARIGNLPPGQSALLSFGIDLNITIDNTRTTQNVAIVAAHFTKGVLTVDRRFVATREYLISNQGDSAKNIVIEQPIRRGWQVAGAVQPFETTSDMYRFRGTAASGKVNTFVVREEAMYSSESYVTMAGFDELIAYSRAQDISPAVREAIARVIELRHAVEETDGTLKDIVRQLNDITTEQGRLRDNLQTVEKGSKYYKRILDKLNEQESHIERLQAERKRLEEQRDKRQKEFSEYLATLTVM